MLTDPVAAEDAVQEAFLRTIRARAGFDPNRRFRIWFYHILRNCCIDELRRRGAAPGLSEEPEALEPRRLAPADPDRIDSDAIVSHIQRLPEIMREALMLRFWSGLTLKEVGRTLGCSTEAAKKRVQRALKQLRDSMSHSRGPAVYAVGGDKTGGKPGKTEGS
jgi:RNA polymerase sigma factor (sigma-70 family)